MKFIFQISVILIFLFWACGNKQPSPIIVVEQPNANDWSIPKDTQLLSELSYQTENSLWTLQGEIYSGYAESYFSSGILKERIGILNGRKQNQATTFFEDAHFKTVAHYHEGKLHGEKKIWDAAPSHTLVAQLNYYHGKVHGEQIKWYPTGELFLKLNHNMGKEEGLQQAFRKNGDLYANYEAREGRIFGLKKAALCFGLADEEVQTQANIQKSPSIAQ